MKIDNRVLSYDINKHLSKSSQSMPEEALEKCVPNEPKAGQAAQTDNPDAVVHIAQAARKDVRLIEDTIASEPDVREDLVTRLKEKIESGRYEIDHAAVADRILDAFEEDLL